MHVYTRQLFITVKHAKLEKQYCDVLKRTLGVNRKVCTELTYIELGLPTLKSPILKRQWMKVERDWLTM